MKDKVRVEIKLRDVLEAYSRWLEKCGYLDSDWWCEEPKAIDRYFEEEIRCKQKPRTKPIRYRVRGKKK